MKLIRLVIICVIVIIALSGLSGLLIFRLRHSDNLERVIVAKITQETAYLANFETMYSLSFTNFRDNWVLSDDFYIRQDQANVYYGYALKDATIRVKHDDGKNTLFVHLPNPKQISIDRKPVIEESRHENYKPVDSEKREINVDKLMNEELNKAILQYEQRSIEMTKEMSRQYFEALAYRFGLELQLEFSK